VTIYVQIRGLDSWVLRISGFCMIFFNSTLHNILFKAKGTDGWKEVTHIQNWCSARETVHFYGTMNINRVNREERMRETNYKQKGRKSLLFRIRGKKKEDCWAQLVIYYFLLIETIHSSLQLNCFTRDNRWKVKTAGLLFRIVNIWFEC
jgi:hypothetical protein